MQLESQAHLRGSANYEHKLSAASHIFDVWTDKGADLSALADRFIDGSVDMLDQFMSESAWSAPPQSYAATRAKGTAATSCAESRHMSSTAAPPGPQMQQRSTSNEPTAAQTAQQTRLAAVSTDGVKKPDALHKHAQKDMPDAHDRPEHVIVRDAAFQEPQQGIPVVHTDDLTYQQFVQCFMLPNLPVMIQGLTCDWQSSKDWVASDKGVDIDFMAGHFGQAQVMVSDTTRQNAACAPRLDMKFAQFAHWWKMHKAGQDDRLLYLKDWHFASQFSDYKAYQTPCYFQEDWLNEFYDMRHSSHCHSSPSPAEEAGDERQAGAAMPGESSGRCDVVSSDYRFVYLGCKGTWTPLHADVLRSYSWSTNVVGRKSWKLLPPRFTHLLYDRFGREMAASFDLGQSEGRDSFPNLDHACGHVVECVQEAGETIFVPSGWHHTVQNLEDTLSINHNWLNGYNIHWALALLQQEHRDATACIEDCREGCSEEEFEGLVQRNMAANCGMDYAFMTEFMHAILHRESQLLRHSSQDTEATHSFDTAKASWVLNELHQQKLAVDSVSDCAFKCKCCSLIANE